MINIILEDGTVKINGVAIDNKIFEEEKLDYTLCDREELIEYLIQWISESQKESDKFLMKEDLKYLMSVKDEYVFSSILTNEYIANSDDPTKFYDICKSLLEQSGLSSKKAEELLLGPKVIENETVLTLMGYKIKVTPSMHNIRSVYYADIIEHISQDIISGNDKGSFESYGVKYEWCLKKDDMQEIALVYHDGDSNVKVYYKTNADDKSIEKAKNIALSFEESECEVFEKTIKTLGFQISKIKFKEFDFNKRDIEIKYCFSDLEKVLSNLE